MEGIEKLWADLYSLDCNEVARRTGVVCLEKGYIVPFFNLNLTVDPVSRRIESTGSSSMTEVLHGNDLTLIVLSFLVTGERLSPQGIWITEKELPGGSLFFQGPHGIPSLPLVRKFGKDAGAFVDRGISLGGIESEFGDGSVEFNVLPGVKLCIALWEADDEFSAECTFMFDRSFRSFFPLDVVHALAHAVVDTIMSD